MLKCRERAELQEAEIGSDAEEGVGSLADRIGDLLKTAKGRAASHFGPHSVQSPDSLNKDVTANIAA